jgi:hypothetical protein
MVALAIADATIAVGSDGLTGNGGWGRKRLTAR